MKIVDCFTFYNELDMLFYRLSVLDPYIDYFVLVEATHTHRGNPKPLFYNENKGRFAAFSHKIIHVIEDGLNPNPFLNPNTQLNDGVWENEHTQRNSIAKGVIRLQHLEDTDLLIISDVDEVPNPEVIQYLKFNPNAANGIQCIALSQDMYYYNLTMLNLNKWCQAKIVSYEFYAKYAGMSAQRCRHAHAKQCIERGGWHFSYFGDPYFIQNKLKQFAHQEWNKPEYTDIIEIRNRVKNNDDLFGRSDEKWVNLPMEMNHFLPPRCDLLPQCM